MHRSPLRLLLILVLVALALPVAAAAEGLFLWRVEGEHATVYLTGSIHVGQASFYPLPDKVEEAFQASDALAVEVDIADPMVMQAAAQLMMTKGLLPGEATLESSLGPEVWKRLQGYAAERDITLENYTKLRPALVAMVLVMEEYKRQGFDETLGIDKHFLDEAREAGMEIRQLETVDAQMALFLDMTDELDDKLVAEVLDQADEIMAFTDKMVAAWRAGDAAALDELLQSQMGDDPDMEEFYRKLLDNRNVGIVATIDQWLREDQDVFVVVGAGHFGGEMGILQLLADKGWDVTQVSR